MLFYDKKIIYLDLQKNGNKVKNAGFLKIEETDTSIKWTIRIKGLYETDMGYWDLCNENGEPVDKILLKKGEGGYCREFEKGSTIENIRGIRISFSDGRCLVGKWGNDAEKTETEAEEMTEQPVEEQIMTGQISTEQIPTEFCMDKWERLQQLYPTVHPFRDEREFLSVTPQDFVILEQRYHKMVRNSFLLHGYYNYRHVILGKYQDKGQDIYYLGVPGVYYDQEKMAAEMFGFEGFEGKSSPAEPGSFGYYMKRVNI